MTEKFLHSIVGGLLLGTLGVFVLGFGAAIAAACLGLAAVLMCLRKPNFYLAAAVCAALALGVLRADWLLWQESQETVSRWYDRPAIVEGIVRDDPDKRQNSLRLAVEAQRINGAPAKGRVLAEMPRDERVSYGDRVRVRGVIQEPEAFEAKGGRVFDYPGYLRVRGISALVPHAMLLSTEPGGFSVRGSLFSLKHRFEDSIERLFSEPSGALLEGVLLGERRGLPKELTDAFIVSSLIHVVVLSGYNMSIVSEAALRSLSFLSPALRYGLGGGAMILFALMTGGAAATVRALIMGLIAVIARYLNRPSAALRALALAVGAMVLWNPLSLLYDTGFVLSIIATFGLIALSPAVEAKLMRLRVFRTGALPGIRSIAASTIAVQIFILPALLYFTGVLSFTALPANLLALPAVPFAMFFGFLAGVLNFLHPLLALIPAAAAHALLSWMIIVAQSAASVPLGSVIIPAFPAWMAFLVYVPLSLWTIRVHQKTTRPGSERFSLLQSTFR